MGASKKGRKRTRARDLETRRTTKTIVVTCITRLACVLNPLPRVKGGGFNRLAARVEFFAPMEAHLAVGGLDTREGNVGSKARDGYRIFSADHCEIKKLNSASNQK